VSQIPNSINGVLIEFGPLVVNDVSQVLVSGLTHAISTTMGGQVVARLYVSSAFDQHQLPSRHMQRKAVDISRVNGVKIAIGYSANSTVRAIVDALQQNFETFAARRENFGPHFKRKLGQPWPVAGHGDHVHLSVN
jgi:hypothetical protein